MQIGSKSASEDYENSNTSSTAPQEVQNERYEGEDEDDVDESTGNLQDILPRRHFSPSHDHIVSQSVFDRRAKSSKGMKLATGKSAVALA